MESKTSILKRVYVFFFAIVVFGLVIIVATVNIQFLKVDKVIENVKTTTVKKRTFPAKRGDLYAKDGSLLATSLTYYEVGLDLTSPAIIKDTLSKYAKSLADSLESLIGLRTSSEYYRGIIDAYNSSDKWFLLSKGLDYPEFQKLKTFPFINQGRLKSGLAYRKFTKRKKPFGILASRTIGSRAPFGLEGAYDTYLMGVDGEQLQRRKSNVWVPVNNTNIRESVDGADVYSTIDVNIQEVAENALKEQLFHNNADYGCAVVMEVETGKIRAIANLLIDTATGQFTEARNFAVADAEEPGSTIKLASFMAVLEKNQLDLDRRDIKIGNGSYKVYDRLVKDAHFTASKLSAREIFEKSSNVGTVKLVEKYYKKNPEEYIERLYSFGLLDKLNIDIIGEPTPMIKSPSDEDWYGTTLAWTSHGYESKLTPLQILAFYNSVANNGKLLKPIFIEKIVNQNKKEILFQPQVIKSSICSRESVNKLKGLLEGVVKVGTAKRPFRGSLYKVAGKTGTAVTNYSSSGVTKKKYRSSFVGYFPADNPRYSCIVVITNPRQNGIYGSTTAAPVFRKISDRVYTLDKELRTELVINNKPVNLKTKNGREKEMVTISENFNIISNTKGSSNYVSARIKKNELQVRPLKELGDNLPNVKGLTIKDALYILERKGLKVSVKGKGRVVKQSLRPGSKVVRGKQIEIILG